MTKEELLAVVINCMHTIEENSYDLRLTAIKIVEAEKALNKLLDAVVEDRHRQISISR